MCIMISPRLALLFLRTRLHTVGCIHKLSRHHGRCAALVLHTQKAASQVSYCTMHAVLTCALVVRWSYHEGDTQVPLTCGPWAASLGSCCKGWLAWGQPPPRNCRWPPCLLFRANPEPPLKGMFSIKWAKSFLHHGCSFRLCGANV